MTNKTQQTTLAGGCFWCIQTALASLKGIIETTSGYMGGASQDATYRQVCTGKTGHAEVVQVRFDPELITYREILEVFFTLHDPTQLNRQGDDIGSQYRSAIFYHSLQQQQTAQAVLNQMAEDQTWPAPVVTEISPANDFYPGEKQHQDYYDNNSDNQYCQVIISPKLAKFRKTFSEKLMAVA
jgi:peptide-methionine (S)-S-oxide reductase